jgi:hypothetical protein
LEKAKNKRKKSKVTSSSAKKAKTPKKPDPHKTMTYAEKYLVYLFLIFRKRILDHHDANKGKFSQQDLAVGSCAEFQLVSCPSQATVSNVQ